MFPLKIQKYVFIIVFELFLCLVSQFPPLFLNLLQFSGFNYY